MEVSADWREILERQLLGLGDPLNMELRELRETDGSKDSDLGVRMNGGPIYCSFRQDKEWKLSLNLGTWRLLVKMTKESFSVRVHMG